jgi:FixJ family two-component response regulator
MPIPEATRSICILDDDLSVLNSLQELPESDGFEAEIIDTEVCALSELNLQPSD